MTFENDPKNQVPEQDYEAFEAALKIAQQTTQATMLRLVKVLDENHAETQGDTPVSRP